MFFLLHVCQSGLCADKCMFHRFLCSAFRRSSLVFRLLIVAQPDRMLDTCLGRLPCSRAATTCRRWSACDQGISQQKASCDGARGTNAKARRPASLQRHSMDKREQIALTQRRYHSGKCSSLRNDQNFGTRSLRFAISGAGRTRRIGLFARLRNKAPSTRCRKGGQTRRRYKCNL